MEIATRLCSGCKQTLALNTSNFQTTREGFRKTCISCLNKQKLRDAQKKKVLDADKENSDPDTRSRIDEDDDDETLPLPALPAVDLPNFLASVESFAASEDVISLDARVNVTSILREASDFLNVDKKLRFVADSLAEKVWKLGKYRYICYKHKQFPGVRFKYHCAQINTRQHKPQKSEKDGTKLRDKNALHTFPCSGWMHITIFDGDDSALIRLKHLDAHVPYYCIDVPKEVQEFVRNHPHLNPSQLWTEILKMHPKPAFARKAIYQLWIDRSSQDWKRAPDEVESAKILIEEASRLGNKSLYQVESIAVHGEEGFIAIAFALTELLHKWAGQIREISLDSAWNTNGSDYEVYALLGEVYGSGCPLGYLLMKSTSSEANPGGKERFIADLLRHMKQKWLLKPIITLTDKDLSEINAFQNVFHEAKHQLCFWHCLRAIKDRLAKRRHPKKYNVLEAKHEFPWIEEDFVPIAQAKKPTPDTYVAQKAIPQLKLRIGGVLQNTAPEPSTIPPRLVVKLNGVIRGLVPIPAGALNSDETVDDPDNPDVEDDTLDDSDEEDGELLREVRRFYKKSKGDQIDDDDGPDWMFEEGEHRPKDPNYVFCPPAHRKQVLHLFTKHFCQHPLLPEKDGKWDYDRTRREAVYELYQFCKGRGLREVWGYMWACWYSPKMWKLWARSTSQYLSRLRTTMNVENFWRQLKHDYLYRIARPRLDHLIWILINKVTPAYVARAEILDDSYRLGRARPLTTYQTYFKKSWKELLERKVSNKVYQISIKDFTCSCGRQKYDAHLLCKHLVQSIELPSTRFWCQVIRRRTLPFYHHKELKPKEGSSSGSDADDAHVDGGITDGDDHEWTGDAEILEGGGGWSELLGQSGEASKTSKRKRARNSTEKDQSPRITEKSKRARVEAEIIDLTSSSPGPIPVDDIPEVRSSSPLEYGSEDEYNTDLLREKIKAKALAFKKASEILLDPSFQPDHLLLKYIAEGKLGNDVVEWVEDINRVEKTGRKRDTTWALGKGRREKQRARNTMGYHRGRGDKGAGSSDFADTDIADAHVFPRKWWVEKEVVDSGFTPNVAVAFKLQRFKLYLSFSFPRKRYVPPFLMASSTLFSIAVCAVILFWVKRTFMKKHPPLPPGPPGDPIIGNIRSMPSEEQDVVEAAVELLDKRGANYSGRPRFPLTEVIGFKQALVFLDYGDDFRLHRKMLQKYFAKDKVIQHNQVLTREARLLAHNLASKPQSRDIMITRYATAVIIAVSYGHQITNDEDDYLKSLMIELNLHYFLSKTSHYVPLVQYFPSWFPGLHYVNVAKGARSYVRKLYEYPYTDVKEKLANGTANPSFLATQLEELQRGELEPEITIEHIQGASGILYVAGAETTSSTMSTFIFALLLHPECQIKAQEEIDRIVGPDRLPEFSDRESLPYVECLLQETQRWHPTIPFGVPHYSMEDDVYDGMFIPKGSMVLANARGMTWNENVYEDPFTFNPDRFLPKPQGRGEPHPPAFYGFGRRSEKEPICLVVAPDHLSSTRICPGRYLAEESLWIAMVTILTTLSISKVIGKDGKEITPPIKFKLGVTSQPCPFEANIQPRNAWSPDRIAQIMNDSS
ncbi:hypothetical protein H0H93_014943 [Arthromyces matolae]|nr:hypothetical protein H0H93_014943 [Arthromyces matolae]